MCFDLRPDKECSSHTIAFSRIYGMTQQHKHMPMANELLLQARMELGLTQRRLADELEVGEQTVRSWERGTRSPSLEMRKRLCELFAKTPEQLGLQRAEKQELMPQELSKDVVTPPHIWANTNRSRMLKRVRSRWIAGMLRHSLYLDTLISLRLWEQPDATQNPWQHAVQEANSPPHLLPAGTRILQVYDDADGELLILGEPGAGKTTLLLELTRDLLKRAELDETHPMPVVFNISSWMEKHHTFMEWLIEELIPAG